MQIEIPTRAPVMVLPGSLLFPHTLLPLFIFEQRYREMLSWALERERMFCIGMVRPGIPEAFSTDDFYDTGTIGMVRACVGNEDGTSNLILQGITRVRFTNFHEGQSFRMADLEALPSVVEDGDRADALRCKVLEICNDIKASGLPIPRQLEHYIEKMPRPDILIDLLADSYVQDVHKRQQLLEERDVSARFSMLLRFLKEQFSQMEQQGPDAEEASDDDYSDWDTTEDDDEEEKL